MPDLTPGVPSALSPLVRRIVAPNPGPFTGPGTNTYLVGIDEVAVIDPGPDDQSHIDAIVGASMRERVRWVVLTHTHPDHAPGTERLVKATGAEVLAYGKRIDKDATVVPDRVIGEGDTIEGTEFGLDVLHTPGPRAQPSLLPARGGAGALHRRQRARGHVLGDQPGSRRRHDRLPRHARAAREAPCARVCAPVTATSSKSRGPGSRSTPRTGSIGNARCCGVLKAGPARIVDIVTSLYGDQELHPKLVEAAGWQVHAHLVKLKAEGKVTGTSVKSAWKLA